VPAQLSIEIPEAMAAMVVAPPEVLAAALQVVAAFHVVAAFQAAFQLVAAMVVVVVLEVVVVAVEVAQEEAFDLLIVLLWLRFFSSDRRTSAIEMGIIIYFIGRSKVFIMLS
jgi:hypothetical protein